MLFDPTPIIDRLERALGVVPALCRVCSAEDSRWKPPPTERYPKGAWSVLEIASHLLDEETDDFRTRLRQTLEDPASPWPGWDPEGRASRDGYNEKNLDRTIAAWERERRASIAWLRGVEGDADWNSTYLHPRWGPFRAGDLLSAWAAHDALHIRQIAKRLFELSRRDGEVGGFVVKYAGDWGA